MMISDKVIKNYHMVEILHFFHDILPERVMLHLVLTVQIAWHNCKVEKRTLNKSLLFISY